MKIAKASVLVVDDDRNILELLKTFLDAKGYECHTAENAEEALHILADNAIDVALVDIVMTGKSGISLMEDMKKHYPSIPCIVITGVEDEHTAKVAFEAGAYGYLVKPFKLFEILINLENALKRKKLEESNREHMNELQVIVNDRTRELQLSVLSAHQMIESTIKMIASIVEVRDPYTAGHQNRVANLASAIAQELGLPSNKVQEIYIAALIHDIGKIGVPSDILTKPGRLDPVEFELVKRHTTIGYNLLKDLPFSFPLHEIIYQHHERFDGSGYPRRINGEDILIEARIIGVSDVVEAIASHRPYRPALGINVALEEIKNHSGKLYDPQVVASCVKLFEEKGFLFESKNHIYLE